MVEVISEEAYQGVCKYSAPQKDNDFLKRGGQSSEGRVLIRTFVFAKRHETGIYSKLNWNHILS